MSSYFAVRSVEGTPVNKIFASWDECKPYVYKKKDAIYKTFFELEEAQQFISMSEEETNAVFHGYKGEDSATLIRARFLFPRFYSKESGYCVYVFKTRKGTQVMCTGTELPTNKKLWYNLGGKYEFNKYGRSFVVESFKPVIVDTKDGIISYLSSGVIKGVGKKKAEAIYAEFGEKTMEVLDKKPERLKYVKGFSKESAKSAVQQLKDAKGAREITQYLLQFGISQKYAMQIFNERRENSLRFIQRHPYELCRFNKVDFETADFVAKDCGISPENEERMKYCVYYILKENEMSGSRGMKWEDFLQKLYEKLGEDARRSVVYEFVNSLIHKKYLFLIKMEHKGEVNHFIFTGKIRTEEEDTAKNVLRLMEDTNGIRITHIEEKIRAKEKKYGVAFDETQKDAIRLALTGNPFTVLCGGPGTGKTMLVKIIAEIYEEETDEEDDRNNVVFLAPTGRAARRLEETSGREAYTIHHFLRIKGEEDALMNNTEDDVVISNALVVIDEFSMVDSAVAYILFKAMLYGVRVLIVGDPDQLPSVGAGAVLRDLIECNGVKTICLTKIYRQQNSEKIISNSNMINNGDGNIEEGSDFHIFESDNIETIQNLMVERYKVAVEKYGIENVMCLCPFKEHSAGVNALNNILQDTYNPKSNMKAEITAHEEIFRVGDMVMNLHNSEFASNGDIGRIEEISEEDRTVIARFNGSLITYTKDNLKHITRAYATTVHKSQGSEALAVVCCFSNFHKNMLYRALPYVAFSRGQKEVDFIGEVSALVKAAAVEVKNERVTLFGKYMKFYLGEFVSI